MSSALSESSFWAKLDDHRKRWHPLVGHSADVAAVVERLVTKGSTLGRRLGTAWGRSDLSRDQRRAVVYLAALHDLGKANHGFQEKRLPPSRRRRFVRTGHVKVVFESLTSHRELQETVRAVVDSLGGGVLDGFELLRTVLCHHGRPWGDAVSMSSRAGELWDVDSETGRDPLAMIRHLHACATRWSGLPEDGLSLPPLTPEATHYLAGTIMLADWIGSTEEAFGFEPEADVDPDAYWETARQRADRACRTIGVVPSSGIVGSEGHELLRDLFPTLFGRHEPTPLQRFCAEAPLPSEGSRILVESETGSGKTEAALTLYARLRRAGRVDGLVFALPTRATAGAMLDRIGAVIETLYEPGARPTIALAMGGEAVRGEGSHPLLEADGRTFDSPEDVSLARWSSESAKKFFAAEIVVGTIDQVLLAGLLVNHAHLRLAALGRHLIVVDELHSFDRYMSEVLARFLDTHTGVGGVALFMSATLSQVERCVFGGKGLEPAPLEEATVHPYPMISMREPADAGWVDHAMTRGDGGLASHEKEVTWSLVGEDEGLSRALAAARAGARVCVLRNLVRSAIKSADHVRTAGGEALLWRPPDATHAPAYHSRYALPDRKVLDTAALAAFGRGKRDSRPFAGEGILLCSTQLVEQSLDVDFDFLVTDLCPVDVLLQRIGRLHRHPERSRPSGYEMAEVMVLGPSESLESVAVEKRATGPHGWGTVYEDLGDLELTRRLIGSRPSLRIPRDSRTLIESVYHPENRENLRSESDGWRMAIDDTDGKDAGRRVYARQACLEFSTCYSGNAARWPGAELDRRIRTRLGDDRVSVDLPGEARCQYADGHVVTQVDIPAWVLGERAQIDTPRIEDWTESSRTVEFKVNGRGLVRYDRDGWHWSVP